MKLLNCWIAWVLRFQCTTLLILHSKIPKLFVFEHSEAFLVLAFAVPIIVICGKLTRATCRQKLITQCLSFSFDTFANVAEVLFARYVHTYLIMVQDSIEETLPPICDRVAFIITSKTTMSSETKAETQATKKLTYESQGELWHVCFRFLMV